MSDSLQTVDEAAALWAVRLAAGELRPPEQQALDEWLAERPQHHGALVRARAVWADLDRIAALSPAAAPAGPTLRQPSGARRWAMAAGLAALAVGAAVWYGLSPRADTYVSAVGEIRRISLADGSNVVLNTASEARVLFTDSMREIRLVRGEALFEVAKQPSRPFVVRAERLTVKAIGTAFAVRIGEQKVDVTVTEGVVEVARHGASATQQAPRRVVAQQHAVARAQAELEVDAVGAVAIDRQLAWRQGMVAFDGEPLSEAVAQINRHSRRHIVVDDPQLAQRPVVGMFRANDADSFAQAARETFDAELIEREDTLHLRPRT